MSRSTRKWEHIQQALAQKGDTANDFDKLKFVPNSLPNVSYERTSLAATLAEWQLSSPILINAMTGGSRETMEINRRLAILAREKGLAMAVGSQMAALNEPQLEESYRIVRKENPTGLVLANLGAEASVEQAKQAIEMIEADGLQIHLNVMQELIMPEGDRDFFGYLTNIERIANGIEVPLIVKEVGFGMSRQTIRRLLEAGVRIIDVGGYGGTNFARIENKRRENPLHMFDSWGLSTVQSLLEAVEWQDGPAAFIASGGVRHGLDVCKAFALGASAAGMAGIFLQMVQTMDMEQCLKEVDMIHRQIRIAMTALGCEQLQQLRSVPFTLGSELYAWAEQRRIRL